MRVAKPESTSKQAKKSAVNLRVDKFQAEMSPLLIVSFIAAAFAGTAGSAFATRTVSVDVILKQHQQTIKTIISTLQSNLSDTNGLQNCYNYIEYAQQENLFEYVFYLNQCAKIADMSLADLSQKNDVERAELLQEVATVVDYLHICENETDAIKFFSCYSEQASWGTGVFKNVSIASENYDASLPALYQQIDSAEAKCNASAEAEYVFTSTEINLLLEKCINGTFVPPTAPTTRATSPATTPDTTTDTTPDSTSDSTSDSTPDSTPDTSSTPVSTTPSTTPDYPYY